MSIIKERYSPLVVDANSTIDVTGDMTGGFLAVTAGTITLVNHEASTVLSAFPVIAGQYVPMPIYLGSPSSRATFTTAGGASGTLLV